MKKLVMTLLFGACAINAQDVQRKSLERALRVDIELRALKPIITAKMLAQNYGSAPDFFGVTQDECLLREGLACCAASPRNIHEYLHRFPAGVLRTAVALNWFTYLHKQERPDVYAIQDIGERYKLTQFVIEGKDVRQYGHPLKLANEGRVSDAEALEALGGGFGDDCDVQ